MNWQKISVRGEIETLVSLVFRGVFKKDTPTGMRGDFMGSGGRGVQVAGGLEDP
jgi:hypothetical protein